MFMLACQNRCVINGLDRGATAAMSVISAFSALESARRGIRDRNGVPGIRNQAVKGGFAGHLSRLPKTAKGGRLLAFRPHVG